jgi:DnaJ like chaperone protein
MGWWGKLLGGAFGFALGGPLGALLGTALGHSFDRGLRGIELHDGADTERVQTAFFTASFAVMGHLAKADGRVSEREIVAARAIMDHMRLDAGQREVAMRLFRGGKSADFDLEATLRQLRQVCGRRINLLQMFIEIQLSVALADGEVAAGERKVLEEICAALGYPVFALDQLIILARAAREGSYRGTGDSVQRPAGRSLEQAYGILGLDRRASDSEVKRAYRRLMSQHHPDKLVARGLPEEMSRLATERTQEIRAAYEQIKTARGTA